MTTFFFVSPVRDGQAIGALVVNLIWDFNKKAPTFSHKGSGGLKKG
jgi:hypothetical protein